MDKFDTCDAILPEQSLEGHDCLAAGAGEMVTGTVSSTPGLSWA